MYIRIIQVNYYFGVIVTEHKIYMFPIFPPGFNEVFGPELPGFVHPDDHGCLSLHNETGGRFCLGKRSSF